MPETDKTERNQETAGLLVEVQLSSELAAGLKRHIASHPEPRPTPAEAIRQMMTDWLSAHGYRDGDGLAPDELNSSNDG